MNRSQMIAVFVIWFVPWLIIWDLEQLITISPLLCALILFVTKYLEG